MRRNGKGNGHLTGTNGHASPSAVEPETLEPDSPAFSEDALALDFAHRYAAKLRYVSAWGSWMEWDSKRWARDETLRFMDKTRILCRGAANSPENNNIKFARQLASNGTAAAVEKLSRSDQRLAATSDQWDADHWLLNTPVGAMDLKSGKPPRTDPKDYCTKITAVEPAPEGAECPIWHRFMERVLPDPEVRAYLKRVAGYCLTGSVREHALFFFYGTGRNGKGVWGDTVSSILGHYATPTSMDVFTATGPGGDRHPTELAALQGARLVTAVETSQGSRWNEAKIAQLTGGDKIKARFMRQDFFDFYPQFKLIIQGNHKPALRGVNEAMRARFNIVPFTVTIPPEERDPDLKDKLRAEWPAILRWMIEGCGDWQEMGGLRAPKAVANATDDYIAGEDAIGSWLEQKCEEKQTSRAELRDLFQSWKKWAEASEEFVGSEKRFGQELEARGYVRKKHPETRRSMFEGLRVRYETEWSEVNPPPA